tara:strand:+ start:2503 stop:6666 length:4164 start_codon:yes stop_codon:yes gene_type:complete
LPFETEVQPLEPEVVARFNKPEGTDAGFMPRLAKQAGAAFRLENSVGSALAATGTPDANLAQTDPPAAALFDAEEFLAPEEKAYSERFTGANSFRDIEAIRYRIADENNARQAMAEGPLPEWLIGTVAAIVDPTTVIPVAGPLIKGGRAAVALGSFARVGVSAAAGAGVQEAILQGTQVTRTAEESAASVVGALILGGVLGTVAGTLGRRELIQFNKQMDGVRKKLESDITQTLRASNLGELPPPKAGLMDTTAVGRFLDADTSPNFTLPRSKVVKAADNDILNYIAETQPKLLDDVTRLSNDIQKADERISKLEADPTTPVTRMVMPRDQLTIDLMKYLADEGTPAAKKQLADIQESLQPKVTLNRLKRENEDLLAEWEAAETRLAKTIEKAKKAMAEIEDNLTPKARAEASLEIARMQAAFEKELAEGRDPLKLYPQGDPLDWLRGFAQFPKGPPGAKAGVGKPGEVKAPVHPRAKEIKEVNESIELIRAEKDTPQAVKDADIKELEDKRARLEAEAVGPRAGGDPNAKLAADVKRLQKERAEKNAQANEANDRGDTAARDRLFEEAEVLRAQEKEAQVALDAADKQAVGPKDASSAATGPGAPVSDLAARLRNSFKVAEITAKLAKIGMAMPSLYMSTSLFETSRKAINRFAYTGLLLDDHFKGARHADDFETEVKYLGEPAMVQMQRNVDTAWSDYKQAVKAGEAPKMTRGDFYDAIGTAMTQGDKGAHDIISNAAKAQRVIDKHFADMATEWEVGVFKNPEAAAKSMKGQSHLQRVYHHERIKANSVGWRDLVKDYFRRGGGDPKGKPADEDWLEEMADGVTSQILGHQDGRLPGKISVPEGRGSAKERTFDIPDNWRTADGRYAMTDFVDRNVVNVMSRYIRTMASDIAYQKIMGGDEGIAVMLKQLRDEKTDMLAALAEKSDASMSKGTPPKTGALEKKNLEIEAMYERDKSTIEALVHRIRGTDPAGAADPRYAGARTIAKVIKNSNVPLFMGSSLISQLPDLGRMVMSEGIIRVFGGMVGHFADGFKSLKMSKAEGQRVGTINDMLMGGRAGTMADIGEQYTNQSKAEMISGLVAHKSLILFGVSPWNTVIKSHASYLGADTILRRVAAMADGKPLSDVQAAQMRAWGIGDYEVEQIVKERELWGESTRGAFFSNADQWKNLEARNAFERALLRYIDGNILTPGATDKPLWTQGPVGSVITQFQGFGFASHTRILVAGLQQRDANALSSMLAMVGLGMTSVALRDLVRDGKVDDKRTTRAWVRDGIDRSGVLAHLMNLDAIVGKATGVNVSRTLTGEDAAKFQGRSLVGQLGGPTAATIDGTARALRGIMDGSVTGADVHAIRKTVPYQNFLATGWLFDKVEKGLVDTYGLTPRQLPQ